MKVLYFARLILIFSLLVSSALGEEAKRSQDELASEEELYTNRKTAFTNPKEDHPDRPNVLLIGDSISIGYTAHVRLALQDRFDVYRLRGNGKHSSFGLKQIDAWLEKKPAKWDLIHFNWGLWDLCYRHPESKEQGHRDKVRGTLTTSLEDYESNLEKIVLRLKETEATLIWAAITPVPEGEAGRKLGDDLKYNQVAAQVMEKHGVIINDLHTHALEKLPETRVRKGDVHFTKKGYQHLSEKVVAEILAAREKKE